MWTPTLAWLAAVAVALALALAAPSESHVMGQLPAPTAQRLDQHRVSLSHGFAAERILALVVFNRGHRAEVESWIQGLRLNKDSSIAWFKMPVLNDPGSDGARADIERQLLARHSGAREQSRVVPVFANREAFIREAGLTGEHASVLVLNRDGKVLARAEGLFDEQKAEALRETLLAQGD